MVRSLSRGVCACVLGAWLCWGVPAGAQTLVNPVSSQTVNRGDLFDRLSDANAIYLGEVHSRPEDRQAQLEILQTLYDRNPNLAVGLEMFERSQQAAIDGYLSGELSEAEFLEVTQFERRWGFPWESYAPILRFAKANNLPVLALNAPIEAVRQVAVGGFENITEDYRHLVPPMEELRADNAEYRQRLREIYDSYHHGEGSSDGFDNFFNAQVLWDETMADSVAQFLEVEPNRTMVAIAGRGHVVYGDGIPSRVARRLPQVRQVLLVFEDAEADVTSTGDRPIADYIWLHD